MVAVDTTRSLRVTLPPSRLLLSDLSARWKIDCWRDRLYATVARACLRVEDRSAAGGQLA